MEQFVGKFISVNCGDILGSFQGQIVHVDPCTQKLTLERAFHNGCPYVSRQVVINAEDIKNLEMIDAFSDPSQLNSIKIKKPVAKKASSSPYEGQSSKEVNMRESPRKTFEENRPNNNSTSINNNGNNNNNESSRTPSKKEKQRQRWISRDEAAFGSPIDQYMLTEFDFEKNLALFNKKAFYEELNASKSDFVKQTGKRAGKYRWDENVLNSKPAAFRQLLVPQSDSVEYVTDTGLIVPSITHEARKQIFSTAERYGLTFQRQSEIIGRACTEMVLLLLGGAHRLNPQNQHQCPNVVALCGSHRTGSQGVNAARQLAGHGVKTTVFIQNFDDLTAEMSNELELYRLTCNKVTTKLQDLQSAPVDLIIVALSDPDLSAKAEFSNPEISRMIASPAGLWANENRAPVLCLDPPPEGTPGLVSKCSLIPGLPLAYESSNGKIYLCNVGIPLQVFKDVGIKYVPPFGPKFFMPLYPNNV